MYKYHSSPTKITKMSTNKYREVNITVEKTLERRPILADNTCRYI